MQTHLWTKHSFIDITLFNEALKNFESLIEDRPELDYKVGFAQSFLNIRKI